MSSSSSSSSSSAAAAAVRTRLDGEVAKAKVASVAAGHANTNGGIGDATPQRALREQQLLKQREEQEAHARQAFAAQRRMHETYWRDIRLKHFPLEERRRAADTRSFRDTFHHYTWEARGAWHRDNDGGVPRDVGALGHVRRGADAHAGRWEARAEWGQGRVHPKLEHRTGEHAGRWESRARYHAEVDGVGAGLLGREGNDMDEGKTIAADCHQHDGDRSVLDPFVATLAILTLPKIAVVRVRTR